MNAEITYFIKNIGSTEFLEQFSQQLANQANSNAITIYDLETKSFIIKTAIAKWILCT